QETSPGSYNYILVDSVDDATPLVVQPSSAYDLNTVTMLEDTRGSFLFWVNMPDGSTPATSADYSVEIYKTTGEQVDVAIGVLGGFFMGALRPGNYYIKLISQDPGVTLGGWVGGSISTSPVLVDLRASAATYTVAAGGFDNLGPVNLRYDTRPAVDVLVTLPGGAPAASWECAADLEQWDADNSGWVYYDSGACDDVTGLLSFGFVDQGTYRLVIRDDAWDSLEGGAYHDNGDSTARLGGLFEATQITVGAPGTADIHLYPVQMTTWSKVRVELTVTDPQGGVPDDATVILHYQPSGSGDDVSGAIWWSDGLAELDAALGSYLVEVVYNGGNSWLGGWYVDNGDGTASLGTQAQATAVNLTTPAGTVTLHDVALIRVNQAPDCTGMCYKPIDLYPASRDGLTPADGLSANMTSWFTDPDGDALTYVIKGYDMPTAPTISGSTITWTPAASDAGTYYYISVAAVDPSGAESTPVYVNIFVDAIPNSAPSVVAPGVYSGSATPAALGGTPAAVAYSGSVASWFTDLDGDTLGYTVISNSGAGTASLAGSTLTYTPVAADAGTTVVITVQADDGILATITDATLNITVAAVPNTPPAVVVPGVYSGNATPASADGLTAAVPYSASVSAWFTDADGDTLTYAVASNSGAGAASFSGATLTFTPAAGDASSTVTLTVKANDGTADSAVATVTVTVGALPPNAPVDKTALANLIAAVENTAQGTLKGDYTDDSYDAFLDALDDADAVMLSSTVTQADVDAAVAALQAAVDALWEVQEITQWDNFDGEGPVFDLEFYSGLWAEDETISVMVLTGDWDALPPGFDGITGVLTIDQATVAADGTLSWSYWGFWDDPPVYTVFLSGTSLLPDSPRVAAHITPPAQLQVQPGTVTISGTVQVGQTVTAVPGTWTPSNAQLSYQWKVDGTVIPGATASTYTILGADQGKTLTVTVTGVQEGYLDGTATSAGQLVP
ncbi:MAG: FIVAR domain-containing protein, partial [Bifidobacteriaceae bacterium]|nr:FIVAR domain-containing protein [Bifidobacteriaceae bacterium]